MPTPSLEELRARAAAHQEHLDRNTKFYTVADLAARWGCSKTSVRAISAELLPYLNVGSGLQRELRRYRPADVEAFEATRRGSRKVG
jgi:hypothetical protein